MIRRLTLAALGLLLALPLAAQVPPGLRMRVDKSTDASDPDDNPEVKVMQMGNQLHVTTGPAVVLYKDTDRATGNYTLKGTFTMLAPSGHRNFYGLVFGGTDLNGANEHYTYFMVAQTGEFIIKYRETAMPAAGAVAGSEAPTVQAATMHAAVVKPDASGHSVNNLEVRVTANQIQYVVNGQVVHTTPKTVTAQLPSPGRGQAAPTKQITLNTDGIWGVRINHVLPGIVVENVAVTTGNN